MEKEYRKGYCVFGKAMFKIFTDEQLKEMAIKKDGFTKEYQVKEVRIRRYFDMNDLKVKAEVETVYRNPQGQYFVATQTF